ncbi:MAG: hypothetical protein JWM95_1631, partial [Gemmatimonadetes bacterium]|nr:hypothetical protein [Gemmatimonadota bacterium]
DLRDTLRDLLASAPHRKHGKHPVAVAVGPTRAQLRRLRNLPAVRDRRALDAIVQESAGRYFRQNGTPMRTTGVTVDAPGEGWAGAIEAPLVQMVMNLCWDAGHHEVVVVPTAAVLRISASSQELLTWRDGDVVLELRHEADALVECRCVPASSAAVRPVDSAHADAVGAARSGFTSPLALRIDPTQQRSSPVRILVAGLVCAGSFVLLLLAPAIRASREEKAALRTLAALSGPAALANTAETQLSERARMLAELARFQRGAPSTLPLLASLTQRIKAPSSIVSLRLDSDGGQMTAVTPSASALVAALREMPEIAAPTIAGAVTPEAQAPSLAPTLLAPATPISPPARLLQRVTIRFHWQGERVVQRSTGASR